MRKPWNDIKTIPVEEWLWHTALSCFASALRFLSILKRTWKPYRVMHWLEVGCVGAAVLCLLTKLCRAYFCMLVNGRLIEEADEIPSVHCLVEVFPSPGKTVLTMPGSQERLFEIEPAIQTYRTNSLRTNGNCWNLVCFFDESSIHNVAESKQKYIWSRGGTALQHKHNPNYSQYLLWKASSLGPLNQLWLLNSLPDWLQS